MIVERTFFDENVMSGGDWQALELAVVRLLVHCGWENIQYVGGSGDKGADILAVRYNGKNNKNESYLFQVKAITSASYVGVSAINQAIVGQSYYRAKIIVVATNGEFTNSAYKRRDQLNREGFNIRLWNGSFLQQLIGRWDNYGSDKRPLRNYQSNIIDLVKKCHESNRSKALFVVATGLGKTVIASTLTDYYFNKGLKKVLVLCHSIELAYQLQKSFWSQLSKNIPTRIFMGGTAPVPYDGINFGLYQTLYGYLGGVEPEAFDLIIVDEAHHALANAFSSCIEHLKPKLLIGMTATPWRGDGKTIDSIFGEPIAKVSLIDGMRMGFLAVVDYRLMCDNINWDELPKLAKTKLSIKDLNKRLFLPQRDDAVIAEIIKTIGSIKEPRVIIFSPSKKHANAFAIKLVSAGITAANMSIDDKILRRQILLDFSSGKIQALTAVDILNEGIDVPDVNILVFLRATHSRRIFIQQLGRGLRLSSGKEEVIVLDFVTDIRRIAAVKELDDEAKNTPYDRDTETVLLQDGVVTFSNNKGQKFIDAWLDEVASLQDQDEAEKLIFPDTEAWV